MTSSLYMFQRPTDEAAVPTDEAAVPTAPDAGEVKKINFPM